MAIRRLLALLFVGVVLYYAYPREQSFSVAASTDYMEIEVQGTTGSEWELSRVYLCVRDDTPAVVGGELGQCDPLLYDTYQIEDAVVRWSAGHRLIFRGVSPGLIEVTVGDIGGATVAVDGYRQQDSKTNQSSIPVSQTIGVRSILRIPVSPEDLPLLPLRGNVSIGAPPNGREPYVLRTGRYEVRQHLAFNRRPSVVAKGEFFAGDRVGIVALPEPFTSAWFASLRGSPLEIEEATDVVASLFVTDHSRLSPAFDTVATTQTQHSALRVTRVGSQPTVIPVTWTQRLTADALPVALATLLGLLGTSVALSNAFVRGVNQAGPGAKGQKDAAGRRATANADDKPGGAK